MENAKQKNKAMSGTNAELLASYLDEFQWRQMFGKKTNEAFDNILNQISIYYPVNNWFVVKIKNLIKIKDKKS